jgi:hypothetical protein
MSHLCVALDAINIVKSLKYKLLVPSKGLEPSHLAALAPHASVSTNSTTTAQTQLGFLLFPLASYAGCLLKQKEVHFAYTHDL